MSSRTEDYWVELLDANDGLIRRLTSTKNGTLTLNVNRPIRGGGKITIIDEPDITWTSHRLRMWFQADDSEPISLGVFVPTSPDATRGDGTVETIVDFHDKLIIPSQDAVDETFSIAAGSIITDVVTEVIESTGENALAITESAATASSSMTWAAGTSKLRIINDLLAYINYFSLAVDRNGVFVSRPYAKPASRPVARIFARGKDSVHVRQWVRSQDLFSVPNKVILVTSGSEDAEALSGTYSNTVADSPYSYQARGRWITHVETGVEAADEATLDSLAERRLISLSSPSATISISHLHVPLELNDVVRFITSETDVLAVVERMDVKLTPGSLVRAIWREVADV